MVAPVIGWPKLVVEVIHRTNLLRGQHRQFRDLTSKSTSSKCSNRLAISHAHEHHVFSWSWARRPSLLGNSSSSTDAESSVAAELGVRVAHVVLLLVEDICYAKLTRRRRPHFRLPDVFELGRHALCYLELPGT